MDPRREHEEQMLAVQLAASVAGSLNQVDKMVMRGSSVSKSQTIDPRKLLPKQAQQQSQPSRAPQRVPAFSVPPEQQFAPRVNLLPTPKGIDPELMARLARDTSGGEIFEAEAVTPQQPISDPVPTSPQLEFDFNKQASINEIFNQLETLNVEIKTIRSLLEKLTKVLPDASNSNTIPEADKKKSP